MAIGLNYEPLRDNSESSTINSVRTAMLQKPELGTKTVAEAAASASAQQQQQNLAANLKQEAQATDIAIRNKAAQENIRLQKLQGVNKDREAANAKRLMDLDSQMYSGLDQERSKVIVDKERNKYMNEQQLMEYKLRTVKSKADWDGYMQREEQLTKSKLDMMDLVHRKMVQQLELEATSEKSTIDQQHLQVMYQIEREWKKKMDDEKRREARNRGKSGLVQAVGSAMVAIGTAAAPTGVGIGVAAAGAAILAAEHGGANEEGGGISRKI